MVYRRGATDRKGTRKINYLSIKFILQSLECTLQSSQLKLQSLQLTLQSLQYKISLEIKKILTPEN